jgi:hypothetical protein
MDPKCKGYMPRICFNLSDETAQRIKEVALRKTGSMKGLSEVGEEALKQYLEENYPPTRFRVVGRKGSDKESHMTEVVQTENAQEEA